MMKKKVHLSLHPRVFAEATLYAQEEQRSLSEVVERLLEREIERARVVEANSAKYFVDEKPQK
jgi:predicted HicB family RNase H-like nuclease